MSWDTRVRYHDISYFCRREVIGLNTRVQYQ
jgi:hypothetical protein